MRTFAATCSLLLAILSGCGEVTLDEPSASSGATGQGGSGEGGGSATSGGGGEGGAEPTLCEAGEATSIDCFAASIEAMQIDEDGAFILGGSVRETVAILGVELSTSASESPLLMKLDAARQPVWVVAPWPEDRGDVRALALAPDGGVVVTGFISRAIKPSEKTTYVAKLDASGALEWRLVFEMAPTGGTSSGVTIAIDDAGLIVVGGEATAAIDTDPYDFGAPDHPVVGEGQGYFVGLDATGQALWEHWLGEAEGHANRVTAAGDGVFLAASSYDDGDGDQLSVRALGPAGELLWERAYSGFGSPSSLTVLPDGAIRVTGVFSGSIGFDPPGPDSGAFSVFAFELDANGDERWTAAFPGESTLLAEAALVDATGVSVFAGRFSAPINGPFGEHDAVGSSDLLIGAIDANGDAIGGKRYGGPYGEYPTSIALDPAGHVWVTMNRLGAPAGRDSVLLGLDSAY